MGGDACFVIILLFAFGAEAIRRTDDDFVVLSAWNQLLLLIPFECCNSSNSLSTLNPCVADAGEDRKNHFNRVVACGGGVGRTAKASIDYYYSWKVREDGEEREGGQ